jgi:hypothetical protein
MSRVEILVDERIAFQSGRYVAYLKVLIVPKSRKFTEGLKVRCVLVDQHLGRPILLLDNHEPFGFHIHTKMPEDSKFRAPLYVQSYQQAIDVFLTEVEILVKNEE